MNTHRFRTPNMDIIPLVSCQITTCTTRIDSLCSASDERSGWRRSQLG